MAAKISLNNVTMQYPNNTGGVLAIKDVCFQVMPGEFCTLLGPNGSGKSTIVNLIAGFISCSAGSITINHKIVKGPGPDRVVVFQDYNLFPWKTVIENIIFGLKTLKLTKQERKERALYYLELVHLQEFAQNYPLSLSGGMRQRLALARALAMEPECILLDEPLAAVDLRMRQILQEEILEYRDKFKQTILMVTHNLDEALFFSDKIIVLSTNPGQVRDIIELPDVRPRDLNNLFFLDLKAKITKQLKNT